MTASDEIYHRILKYKVDRAAKGKSTRVVIAMKSMATSGGYYAACAGDYVFAEPTTLTGNIGVLMPSYNFSALMQKYGVEETTIVSTGAVFKNAGSPFKPEDARDHAYLQGLADNAFRQFKNVVTAGRGAKLASGIDTIADGRVYVADEAKTAGLIDAIGYAQDAYDFVAQAEGLNKPSVVRYQDQPSLASLLPFLMHSNVPAPSGNASSGVTINGVNLNVGADTLDQLSTPRLLYRWRGR